MKIGKIGLTFFKPHIKKGSGSQLNKVTATSPTPQPPKKGKSQCKYYNMLCDFFQVVAGNLKGKYIMDLSTREAIRTLIEAREDVSFKRLENNRGYQQLSERQEKSREMVEKYYQNFEKSDRIAIRRHYEGEMEKTDYELIEVYIQGLQDCFSILGFLSGNEVQI